MICMPVFIFFTGNVSKVGCACTKKGCVSRCMARKDF